MVNLSTARKAGLVAKIAARQVRDTRTFAAMMRACRASATQCGHVLRQLWLEVTGFVFLTLAGIGAIALGREYIKYHAGSAGLSRVALAAGFTTLFGWFGLSSFWRVRKKR